jgi:endonuclease/exonuclease/phosphatase family metal-dependent hydrolase
MSLRLLRDILFVSVLCVPFSTASLAEDISTQDISITTFNIKFYGLNGVFGGQAGSETRDNKIMAHLTKYQIWTDVMIFQEIVDVERLETMVGSNYSCKSYDHQDRTHQHVVLCHKKTFSFVTASDDDNYAIEDVSLDKHRPAVHGILVNKDGKRLLHIIGVHLKAQPICSDIRATQVGIIGDYLKNRPDSEPTIILGDFNSFGDDPVKFSEIFADDAIDMKEAADSYKFSYRSGGQGSKLDRIWHSNSLQVVSPAKVSGPCNDAGGSSPAIKTYNKEVSDHCPVTIKVKVPAATID